VNKNALQQFYSTILQSGRNVFEGNLPQKVQDQLVWRKINNRVDLLKKYEDIKKSITAFGKKKRRE